MRGRSIARALALAASALFLIPQEAAARDGPDSQAEERHRAELEKRDALIADLIERVERLEQALEQQQQAQSNPLRTDPSTSSAEKPEGVIADATPSSPTPSPAQASQEDIDRALEQSLVQSGALLLREGAIQFVPTFNFARRHRDIPVLVSHKGMVSLGELRIRQSDYISNFALRFGLPYDSQFEISIPYIFQRQSAVTRFGGQPLDEASDSNSSFGNLKLSLAHALLSNRDVLPDVIGRVTWNTGTGKQIDNGVSVGGVSSLTGSLTLIKREDPLVFAGSAFYDKSFNEGGRNPGDTFGFSLGAYLAASPETSLRFVFDQQFVSEQRVLGRRLPGSDRNISLLTIGSSSIVGRGVFLDVSAALGLTEDSPDYIFSVSLPVRIR